MRKVSLLVAGLALLAVGCGSPAVAGGRASVSPEAMRDPAAGFPAGSATVVAVAASDLPATLTELDRRFQQIDGDLLAGGADHTVAIAGGAPSQASLNELKQRGYRAVDDRLKAVVELGSYIAADTRMVGDDRVLLNRALLESQSQLGQIRKSLESATETAAAARELERVGGLGVFDLLLPQVHALSLSGLLSQYCSQRLPSIEQHSRDTLARFAAQGRPLPRAAELLAKLDGDGAGACQSTRGGHQVLAGLRPSPWPGSIAGLTDGLALLRQARNDLQQVDSDVAQLVGSLQAAAQPSPSAMAA